MNTELNHKAGSESEAFRRMAHEPGYRKLGALSEQAEDMLHKENYRGVSRMLRIYHESETVVAEIARLIQKSDLCRTPRQAAESDVRELYGRLAETRLAEQGRKGQAEMAPEQADRVNVLIAMHTFMLSRHVQRHPECGIVPPDNNDVKEAVRVLDADTRTSERAFSGLYHFLMEGSQPSMYALLRYDMADDYRLHNLMNNGSVDSAALEREYGKLPDFLELDARLTRKAENALESLCKCPPVPYLEKLNEELEKLGGLAYNPKNIDDPLFINREFLAKYGIDRNAPEKEIARQVETAYRELDARFVRMTGRRPYADDLFGTVKPKAEIKEAGTDKAERQKPKGRRMGF